MEFRNLFFNVPLESLDNYADSDNTQQYWIDDEGTRYNAYHTVYKGSFPNKEKKVMTCSGDYGLSFYIDGTKIAESKSEFYSSLFLNNDYKLYATKSFDNVSLRPYDSMVSHSSRLMEPGNVKEMDLISDVTVKSSFCKETAVIANPYFRSVKSYNDCWELLFPRITMLILLMALIALFLSPFLILSGYMKPNSEGSFNKITIIILFTYILCTMLFGLVTIYLQYRFLCKGGKREVLLDLVGIDDESPYATINFKWPSTCVGKKSREIICHRDIDLKQLLTLVFVSVRSVTLMP